MNITEFMEIRAEILCYNALPVKFSGFLEAEGLDDGELSLKCVDKRPGDLLRRYVPSYYFAIKLGGRIIGHISFRVGYTKSLYYSGQIGYAVDSAHRGKGYAGRACRLMIPLMRAHGMTKVLITNNTDNTASRRVCEKLGARLIRVVKIPRWHELYQTGDRDKNIFEWDINL